MADFKNLCIVQVFKNPFDLGMIGGCKDMAGYRGNAKSCVEDNVGISTTYLKRNGHLQDYCSNRIRWFNQQGLCNGAVNFVIRLTEWDGMIQLRGDYSVQEVLMIAQPCHYGGKRWWFICPLSKDGIDCRKKVKKLYLIRGEFGCRHCHGLTYASAQMHDKRTDALVKDPEKLLQLFQSQPVHNLNRVTLKAMWKLKEKGYSIPW